ncbi:MAG: glycosyltransferase family 9 protein [Janthinobacterium lividum]
MKILILKHGALGDMINATGAFSAIRQAFPQDEITLLTSSRYEDLAHQMRFFNHVWHDDRSKNPLNIWRLCRKISQERFDWVFDLQNSSRTSFYFWLLSPKPFWSGIAPGCSHPQTREDRRLLPASLRFCDQLKMAGLPLNTLEISPDMSWLKTDVSKFALPKKYVLLVPGSSRGGIVKRWPITGYIDLAKALITDGITPVLIGGDDEKEVLEHIASDAPLCLNLGNKTSFLEVGGLARYAVATIGNDTGAVHLSAAMGCPTLILWSNFSSPDVFAPRGANVQIMYQENISTLTSDTVYKEFKDFVKIIAIN